MSNIGGVSRSESSVIAICDLDGTLVDSDRALADAFVALGVDRSEITYGHVLADECHRLGLTVEAYLDAYDPTAARPFPGVEALVARLGEWAICSNKHPRSGRAELDRLKWSPRHAFFADAFDGPKRLAPVLTAMDREPDEVVFLGDTAHDRACASEAGVRFVLAGWNPRAVASPGDLVLGHPLDLLDLIEA